MLNSARNSSNIHLFIKFFEGNLLSTHISGFPRIFCGMICMKNCSTIAYFYDFYLNFNRIFYNEIFILVFWEILNWKINANNQTIKRNYEMVGIYYPEYNSFRKCNQSRQNTNIFYLYEYVYWSKIDLPFSFIVLYTDERQRMIIAAKTNRISENGHGVQWEHIYSHINIYLNWNHRPAFVYSPSIRVPWTVVIMPLQTSRPKNRMRLPHAATLDSQTQIFILSCHIKIPPQQTKPHQHNTLHPDPPPHAPSCPLPIFFVAPIAFGRGYLCPNRKFKYVIWFR